MANAWSFICIYIAAIIYWSVRDLIKIAFLLILRLVIYLYLLNLEYWLLELSKLHVPKLLIVTLMTSTKLMIMQINDKALDAQSVVWPWYTMNVYNDTMDFFSV